MKKEVVLVGCGKQGIKAISCIKENAKFGLGKVYVDKVWDHTLPQDGAFLGIPFSLELSAWSPETPIKYYWLEYKEKMDMLFSEAKMVIVSAGVGGDFAVVAKELLKTIKTSYPEITTLFVGSLPFWKESSYVVNYRTNLVMSYLKKNQTAYSLVSNEAILKNVMNGDYDVAYENAHLFLAEIVAGVLSLRGRANEDGITLEDMCQLFEPGKLIFFSNNRVDLADMNMELDNALLPYMPKVGTMHAKVHIEQTMSTYDVKHLQEIYMSLEEKIGAIQNCFYSRGRGKGKEMAYISLLGHGVETEDRKIKIRKIEVPF